MGCLPHFFSPFLGVAIALADHLTELEFTEKIRHAKDSSVRDRYRAILWIQQGKSRDEIADRLGIAATLSVDGYITAVVNQDFIHNQGKVGKGP